MTIRSIGLAVLLTIPAAVWAQVPEHEAHAGHESQGGHAAHAGHESHAEHAAQANAGPSAAPAAPTTVQLAEVQLRDQTGRPVQLVDDVLDGRLVVMDFIYTSCNTICPVLSVIMGQVQERLGERLNEEVRLVSLSVDPVNDTPQRLAQYADKWGARPGWTFLTGDKPKVDGVLRKLGAYTADLGDHAPMILVGDPVTGRWSRFFGLVKPDALLTAVDELSARRLAAAN